MQILFFAFSYIFRCSSRSDQPNGTPCKVSNADYEFTGSCYYDYISCQEYISSSKDPSQAKSLMVQATSKGCPEVFVNGSGGVLELLDCYSGVTMVCDTSENSRTGHINPFLGLAFYVCKDFE